MGDSQSLLLGLTVTTYLLLLVNVAVFGTYSLLGFNNGLVLNSLGTLTVNNLVFTYITWTAIYVYQIIWVLYALALVVRRKPGDPVLISAITLGLYLLALVLQLVVNTVFHIEVSFPFLLVLFALLSLSLVFSYSSLYANRFTIVKQNLQRTDSLVRGLLINGVDLYIFWIYILAILNLNIILRTKTNPPLNPSIAGAISEALFFTITFVYIMADFTVFDKFSRYTLTPYFIRIWAIAFLVPTKANTGLVITGVFLLTFSFASLFAKLSIIFLRRTSRPLLPSV